MYRVLAVVIVVHLVFPQVTLVHGQEKPIAALGRVASLGDVSESQKNIIANRLETILSESYDLVSQEQYLKAEEAAFAALDLDKCTEDECIRKIQELLQVERLFVLQIIREAAFTQLTLNLIRTEARRTVDGVCEQCSIGQLYEEIDELARNLVAQDVRESTGALIAAQPAGAAPRAEAEKEGGIAWYWWVLGAAALAGVAAAASGGGGGGPATETGQTEITW